MARNYKNFDNFPSCPVKLLVNSESKQIMSQKFVIEINLSRLKELKNPIAELDIFMSLKHMNYSEINVIKDNQITIKFTQRYDFELCTQLLREWGISDKYIHLKHTHKIECPPPMPPSNLKYKYFPKDNRIFAQLKAAMKQHPQFLVQTLHLMNKFNIPPPESIVKVAGNLNKPSSLPVATTNILDSLPSSDEEEESEIEDTNMKNQTNNPVTMPFKRKSHLPKIGMDAKRNKMFE